MARVAEADRERVRYHLGYLNIDPAASIALGFPSAQQAQFLVESAMDRVRDTTLHRVIRILGELDDIENQMSRERKCLKVQGIDTLKIRNSNDEPTIIDLLEREYVRWGKRLANDLGVPLNVYAERYAGAMAGVGNLPVAQV
jgi:hypothetical protein